MIEQKLFDLEKGFENLIAETGTTKNQIETEAGLGNSAILRMVQSNNASIKNLIKIAIATNHTYKGKPSLRKLFKTMEIN